MPDRLILPPLRRTARDAEAFARVVHADQVDKAGRPYVEHLERVAGSAQLYGIMNADFGIDSTNLDQLVQIAWLHDVIEDTDRRRTDLLVEGFSEAVVECVVRLSKNCYPTLSYRDWIAHLVVSAPLPALLVKIADIEDNADPERLAAAGVNNLGKRYSLSLPILRAAAAERARGR